MSSWQDTVGDLSGDVQADFLLPTGILVPLSCKGGQTLAEIKDRLWEQAKPLPLYNLLKQPEWYTLVFVNRKAEQEECLDESRRFCDINMYKPIFKVVEKKGDREEKIMSTKIGWLIGKCLKDFETSRDPEVNDFRISMVDRCRKAIQERNRFTWAQKVNYCYPPDIENQAVVTQVVTERLSPQSTFYVTVHACSDEQKDQRYKLPAEPSETGATLLEKALKRFNRTLGKEAGNPDDYILKVCGVDEYLLGDYALIQYKYIKRTVSQGSSPMLALVLKSTVKVDFPAEEFLMPSIPKKDRQHKPKNFTDLWTVEGRLQVKIVSACNLNVSKDASIQVHAGVFHGDEPLCNSGSTRAIQLQEAVVGASGIWHWNENIEFEIEVRDLPRGARLCLGIYAVYSAKKKKREEKVLVAWVNQPLFDYKNFFRFGTITLPCWPASPEDPLEDLLNPIGTVLLNPNTQDSPSIMLNFKEYAASPIMYPDLEKVLEVASQEMENYKDETLPKTYQQELLEIVERDPLAPLFELDKELVWRFRLHLLDNLPSALPKLLSSVKWNNHTDVAVLRSILQAWRPLQPEEALELLDYAYQDPTVRSFAISCLQSLSDAELSQYLLQLCQALKYESHLDCALAQFLLERAWRNQKLGHYLFWHLRSEMDTPEVSLRFGLILEAYCRGSINHMVQLRKQMDAMGKMKNISELLQSRAFRDRDRRDKAREAMRDLLSQVQYRQVMCHGSSTLNPKLRLGDLRVNECRFYDSKMRPLLLVFDNPDQSAVLQDVRIMFKNGDDLRQDMLTLQIINIMDNIWQQEGLDLRLLPYGCLSTGNRVGFIEIVRKSNTIANIQKEKSSRPKLGLWDSNVLYAWLKEKNPTEPQLQKAAEAFCLSCAGYCVATYVLGIGDRHSDNIMITESGQLFHVDFGHFLGNFKVKFGVRRERVPFVLAHDFEIIIDKHFGFDKFVRLCEDAYLILRRRAALFINLLAMMLQTGIPELRTIDDLNYVRDALVLGVTEKEAKEHFHSKLQEARRNAWSTSLNWYIHGLAKDNRV